MNNALVRFPDSDGFWWMNDPNAYGWEVVRVQRDPRTREVIVYRTGTSYGEEVQTWCVEWVKIDKPNS